jgi:hypothetical protein
MVPEPPIANVARRPARSYRQDHETATQQARRGHRTICGKGCTDEGRSGSVAEIMKREGIEILCGYPVNHLLEFAAAADIRPVIVRQERIGLHMADAISRVTSGRRAATTISSGVAGLNCTVTLVAATTRSTIPLATRSHC